MQLRSIPCTIVVVAFSAALLFACGGGANLDDSLKTRAAFDFGCDEQQIRVTNLGANTRGVEGCGHRATYVLDCSSYSFGNCTGGDWIANTSGGEAAPR
ncbi:MAG: hypothetical protein M3Y87_20560 [Myxococcota bacterium]|nr:hypothetical protein [Myxococcota bacterium]